MIKKKKTKDVKRLDRGFKLSVKERLERRKLVYVYSECQYLSQLEISRLLNITPKTVRVDLAYWRENPELKPIDPLHDPETLRLTQIYKQRLHVESLHKRRVKLEEGYIEGKTTVVTGFSASGPVDTTTVTTCKKFHESQVNDIYKQIEEGEKKMSILLGVWQEKHEVDHKGLDLGTTLNNIPDEEEK